jgi:hypothetical protein
MDDHLIDMQDLHGPEGVLVAPEWPPWSEYNPDDDSLATGWNNLLQVGNEADGDINGMQDQVRPFIPSPILSLTSMTCHFAHLQLDIYSDHPLGIFLDNTCVVDFT